MTLSTVRTVLTSAGGVALLCLVADCQAVAASPPVPARIEIKDFMFEPRSLTITAGSTVTWANLDEEPHTVVSDTALFRSGALDTAGTFSFRFDKPGTYHFACSIHPQMVGTIVVR
jgi:plastocyanin